MAPLLFGSGACALVYQTVWLREFRLFFGASTAANAAVLAVFIGGLGAGGLFFGARADRHERPLAFYAPLELAIALWAGATPALLWLARGAYLGLGGSASLGLVGGTLVRLLLTALVLGGPTVLMGATLPAVARGIETPDDRGRRSLGLLYGINTPRQMELAKQGMRIRCLISYGEYWFPWYMRRLAERPANVGFVIRNMLKG